MTSVTIETMPVPTALSVDGVKTAHFWTRPGFTNWKGMVYSSILGIEFDVHETPEHGWVVSDYYGRDFRAHHLRKAIRKAIEANR